MIRIIKSFTPDGNLNFICKLDGDRVSKAWTVKDGFQTPILDGYVTYAIDKDGKEYLEKKYVGYVTQPTLCEIIGNIAHP